VGELALSHDDRILIIYVQQDLPTDGRLNYEVNKKKEKVMTYMYKPPMTWTSLM
jgi:hypothetical protein